MVALKKPGKPINRCPSNVLCVGAWERGYIKALLIYTKGQRSNLCLRQENKREIPDCAIIPEVGESPWLQVSLCSVVFCARSETGREGG